MLKALELRTPTSCLNKADADEPIFVLRAKDLVAPQALRLWAHMADGIHEGDKIAEALKCATAMENWRTARFDPEGRPWPQAAELVQDAPAPSRMDKIRAAAQPPALPPAASTSYHYDQTR